MRFAFVLLALALGLPAAAAAQSSAVPEAVPEPAAAPAPAPFAPHHALSVSVLGAFGFTRTNLGPFTLAYEWVIDEHWGIFVEGHFLHFHGHPVHINVVGGAAG